MRRGILKRIYRYCLVILIAFLFNIYGLFVREIMKIGGGIVMKRRIIFASLLSILFCFTPFVFAQKEWKVVKESTWQASFSDVFFVDDLNGWIVGSNSTILNTVDGGKTWNQQPNQMFPFVNEFRKVRFINPKIGWIVGENGMVLKTIDGGEEWTKLKTDTHVALLGVSFVDELHGWACGDGGFLMHTNDGGVSWTEQPIDTNNVIEGIQFVTPEIGWSVGGGGTILKTIKGGVPPEQLSESTEAETDNTEKNGDDMESGWDEVKSNTVNTLDSLFMLDSTTGWAVGAGGAIVATVDGINWEVQQSNVPNSNGMPEPIWDVHFANKNVGIAVAEFGVVLRTFDGGRTWEPIDYRPIAARLQGVHMKSVAEAWVVGDKSTILHTMDAGETWEVVSNAQELRAVHFHNDNLGWAVGLAGSVIHTNDGGENWFSQNSGDVFELFGVGFVNAKKGYIVGSNAALIETLDGGKTWNSVSDPGDEGHGRATRIQFEGAMSWKSAMGSYAMSFGSSTHGWAVGETGKAMTTSDAGETWKGVDIDPMFQGAGFYNLFGVHFIDNLTGWIVGFAGTIASTADGGATWDITIGSAELQDVFAINPQTAWVVGNQGTIMITTDGGGTWIDQTVPTEENINAVLFITEKEGWAVGDKGTILYTQDGGVTWLKHNSPTQSNLRDIVKTENGTLWIIGDSTTILRY